MLFIIAHTRPRRSGHAAIFLTELVQRSVPLAARLMSSPANSGFSHYILLDQYPGGAVKLIIGLYLEVNPRDKTWSCFIVASFYDLGRRVLWHKEICLLLRNNSSNRGWSATHGFDSGHPPRPEAGVTGKCLSSVALSRTSGVFHMSLVTLHAAVRYNQTMITVCLFHSYFLLKH